MMFNFGKGEWGNFSPDEKFLAVVNEDRILLWDVLTGLHLHSFPFPTGSKLNISPDSKTLAVMVNAGSADDEVMLWDTLTGEELYTSSHLYSGALQGIAFLPDSKALLLASHVGTVKLVKTLP